MSEKRFVSLETREKIRQSRLGKKWSEEDKDKMRGPRPNMIGNQNSKGHAPNKTSFKKGHGLGSSNVNWNGGVSLNKRRLNEPRYREWRTAVFIRDNFICQECGQSGGDLESHHIKRWADFPELRYEISNGKTLCLKCHNKTKRKLK
jgi:hypothetical protein